MSLLIAWRIFQKPKGHFTVWQQSSQKCKTTSTRSVKHCSETYKASKHELKGHMRNNAYKPSMRLGTVSFSIASILIHTSKYSYIIIWVCTSHMYTPYVVVEVVCWRTCRGSKEKTSQDKKHHKKTANIKMKHGFTVQIRWLTLIHFSLRRSGDSKLTFLTGC